MKKALIIFVSVLISLSGRAQEESSRFNIPIKNWNLKVVGFDNFFPTYLADPLGIRTEVSSQSFKYSDYDYEDKINEGGDYLGRLTILPGVRLSLLKFSPKSNPKLGIEVDIGVITPIVMRHGNHDLIGTDGIYYFAIAGRPTEWLALRFSKHHICTHIGDEFYSGSVHSPTDSDPMITQLPVRDDFIFSAAIKPLHFLGNPQWNILQLYGDVGFFMPGVDFLGRRQNKPNHEAWMNYQAGAELEYYFKKEFLGGLFSAVNVSAYQLNAFYPNISVTGGYIVPQDKFESKLRIGFNYYNGRSLINQFYNKKERFLAFTVTADF